MPAPSPNRSFGIGARQTLAPDAREIEEANRRVSLQAEPALANRGEGCDESGAGVKQELVQRRAGAPEGAAAIGLARELEEGVKLEARAASQGVLDREATVDDVSGAGDGKIAARAFRRSRLAGPLS